MPSWVRRSFLPLLILWLGSAAAFADGSVQPAELEACKLLVAVPQSPVGGSTIPALVTFRWRGPDLDSLRLPFDLHPRYQVYVWRAGERRTFAGETTETALTRFLEPGTWFWSVVGVVSGCTPRPAAPESFVIEPRAECPAAGPSLIGPAAGERLEGSRVTLQWGAVDGADAYQVWLRRDPDAPFRAALTRRTETELELPAGAFRWQVDALVGGCGAIPSPTSGFIVERCSLRAPVLVTPPEGASGVGSPVLFGWTRVPGAISYRLWARSERSVPDSEPTLLAETTHPFHHGSVTEGTMVWWVEAIGESGCSSSTPQRSLSVVRVTGCPEGRAPRLVAAPFVSADAPFLLAWSPVPGAVAWELQEASEPSFASPVTVPTTAALPLVRLERSVDEKTTLYYRVRGVIGCSASRTPFSEPVAVTLTNELASVSAVEVDRVTGQLDLCITGGALRRCAPGRDGDNAEEVSLTLAGDQPWLSIEPSVVVFPPGGRATVAVSVDPRELSFGTSRAAVTVAESAGKNAMNGGASGSVSVSLTLVTPVSSTPGAPPTPDTLILPAVAHTTGAFDSTWESDVRLLNASPFVTKYEVSFTPTQTDGSVAGKRTEIDVAPGETIALDDVLESWFGEAGAIGSLAIRPMEQTSSLLSASSESLSFASSRTFNLSPTGTFGQLIPAVAFRDFFGQGEGGAEIRAVLQQLAETETFRTNVGLVEGSGESADVELAVFDGAGIRLATHPLHLLPGEHKQLDGLLASLGVSGENLRVETTVVSMTGRVSVYASRIDNRTGDPFVAHPVIPESGRKWVIPGVADLETGQASWRTDLRIHNAGDEPVEATLRFYPQVSPGQIPSASVASLEVASGETAAIDDVLATQWGIANVGGAIHVTTASDAELVVTGQTYDLSDIGTYGQFIPAVLEEEAVGLGGRTLQILQVEESDRFRTNLGLAEVSGEAVSVEISAVVPESRVIPKATIHLAPNEFRQIVQVIRALNLPSTYNGRIAVRVTEGAGRVAAYASMVDNVTQDPTYVPGQ